MDVVSRAGGQHRRPCGGPPSLHRAPCW